MVCTKCPIFSEDVIKMGEFHQKNTTSPFGRPCYSCGESDCEHNSTRM